MMVLLSLDGRLTIHAVIYLSVHWSGGPIEKQILFAQSTHSTTIVLLAVIGGVMSVPTLTIYRF